MARLLLGSRAKSPQVHSGTSSPVSSLATSRSREDSPVQSTSGASKRSYIFAERLKGKEKARETDADSDGEEGKVKITRELHVNSLTRLTEAPSTWTVPQDNTAYFLDLSECPEVLDEPRKPGIPRRIDVYLRDEDQDAWGGSAGSKKGDVWVYALGGDCGVCTCEYVSEELFGDWKRYEPNAAAMRDLWNHELDANEHEAASVASILSRIYQRVMKSKCDVECNGGLNQYGKTYFVGCSKWHPSQRWSHICHTIPPNVDEDTFKYVLEHAGRLPEDIPDINVMCALILHPRIKLTTCSKPSTKDDRLLDTAMRAVGSKHLSVRIIDCTVYIDAVQWEAGGRSQSGIHQHMQNSPTHCCLPEDRVSTRKRFSRCLHHVETHEKPLPIKERYIHAVMTKGDFTLVVTLNPQLVYLIHSVLSVVIDYTFKHVEGDMDEWVVSGFSDRFKHRITFARLYCNKKSAAAFHQLFYELFDSIHCVTGQKLKLCPFFPDANGRIIMLVGEVAQALGLGSFLVTYNQPVISNIHTTDPIELLSYVLKTCTVHFQRFVKNI
ncbi:hypothetical protein DFH08DRAFT_826189 [Mycena albidolilacea]|uniref:Uncharacterized protein n=1 Tax=Mycena albidolilacea TaxID=1033008 RepID=A0AAD7E962_9AGAR|nr:hypothetical protein DFH08DRAFT_826189 [Mycena albidolilacea]